MLKNKRGDIASIIYVVMFIFVIGIVLLFINHMNDKIFTEIESNLNDSTNTSTYTEAKATVADIKATDNRVWDYAFLGIFLGSLIAIGLTAYAVRISPVFYWIYGVMSLVVLATGVMLSNIWQDMAADAEFATTIGRFPIANAILGSYYPLIVTVVIILAMIVLFGKPPGQEGYV